MCLLLSCESLEKVWKRQRIQPEHERGRDERWGANALGGLSDPRLLFPASLLRPHPSHNAASELGRASFCPSWLQVGPARPAHLALPRGGGELPSMRTAGRAHGGQRRAELPVKEGRGPL